MTWLGSGETITIRRADSSTGRYGSTELDWSSPTDTAIDGCLFAPQTSTEDRDGRDAVVADATAYLPTGSDVTAADRLVIRSQVYEVDGQPSDWRDPFGGDVQGIGVRLRKVTG